ncbi:MAG: nuclear transport factor 2 family protein [Lysobacter sp.]|nr:nuclear transport factor 2 family protein [Lysobacter sp.]
MQSDIEALVQRNEAITVAENSGDLSGLANYIAPQLAFLRRDGSFVDRNAFLRASKPGRRELRIESVQVFGARAVVACKVTDAGVVTHNLRLFVKEQGEWKLLGWANERT